MVQNQILQYRTTRLLLLAFTAGALLQSCYKGEEADLVVHNANIYSIDDNFSAYNAMAITDGKIVALGAEREILNKYSAKQKVDARKMTVFPGFYDAHSHFLGSANNRGEINLFETESFEDVLDRVGDFAKTSDRNWLVGRGWDQNTWPDKSFPSKEKLDEMFPDRPVFLTRVDGHAALVNQAALDLAGIDQNTAISGGKIEKTEGGDLTGILIDRATELIEAVVEPIAPGERIKLIAEAEKACIEAGLTTVTDAGLSVADVLFIDSLHKSGELKLGIYTMFNPHVETLEQMEQGPILTDRLTARSVKLYSDGALGSRGALLKEPYADDPENYGLQLLEDSVFHVFAEACLENDFQLNTHCIGDSANAHVLRLYASVLERMNDRRWRIEHAQIVSRDDRLMFGDYGIIPSVQPVHATSDGSWAEDRLGAERMENAYAYRTLKKELGLIALGTDFPVERISPIENFYAAVFRKNRFGEPEDGFRPEESLTRQEALRGITIWAALASFEDDKKGSLEVGKQADFIVLDRNLIKAPEDEILKTKVLATYIHGEEVYRSAELR